MSSPIHDHIGTQDRYTAALMRRHDAEFVRAGLRIYQRRYGTWAFLSSEAQQRQMEVGGDD